MKKTFTFWVFFALLITETYAQVVTTINYTNAPLNPGNCNVFNTSSPAIIGGRTHYPVCGGVTYNGKDVIRLLTVGGATPSATTGTAYAIAYNFKKGHTYNVSVLASGSTNTGPAPTLFAGFYAQLPDPNQTQPALCGAVSSNAWTAVQTGNAFDVIGANSGSYGFTPYTPQSDLGVLTILATSHKNGGADTVKIYRVSIQDVVPLTLATTSVTKTCGTAISPVIAVSNPNNIAVTSYTWNLGSANNGWMYNGSAAPQTIVTTTNAITLTSPACGTPMSDITVSALVDGITYNLGTVTASTVTPPFEITGSQTVCTTGAFAINNNSLPCGTSVAWSVEPDGIVNLTQSNNAASVTKIFDDQFTIKATISGGCLTTPMVRTKTVVAGVGVQASYTAGPDGPYSPTAMPTSPTPNFSTGGYITYFGTLNTTGLSNIAWSTKGNPYSFNGFTSSFQYTERRNGALVYVVLDAIGSCGPIHKEYPFLSLISGGSLAMNIYPNPAKGAVTVSLPSPATPAAANAKTGKMTTPDAQQYVYAVKLTDINGRVVKQIENKSGATPLTISLTGVPAGYYLLSAFDGKTWTTRSMIVSE